MFLAEIASSTLTHVVQEELANSKKGKLSMPLSPYFHNVTISAIAQSICSTLPRLTSMVSRESFAFSESLIIQIVYLAKEPLFVVDPGAKKKSEKEGMAIAKTLRMEALSLLRGVSWHCSREKIHSFCVRHSRDMKGNGNGLLKKS